jgi:hypothetical protein
MTDTIRRCFWALGQGIQVLIKMIGHACLLSETEDVRILMDPWISGPANFRSWWHFPEVNFNLAQLPRLDYIYISHLHNDHFHPATLAQIEQRPVILVPRLYHSRLIRHLHQLGYTKIVELPHGKEVALSPLTSVQCLQMGNDSLLVVGDSTATMLNANDCLQGNDPSVTLPLLRSLSERRKLDIAFLAFGTAGPYPKCYRFEDSKEGMDPRLKERAMVNTFVQGAMTVRAKAAVPFAGGFALLADKLMWMNNVKSTPRDALEALWAKDANLDGFEMNPGDVWDSGRGLTKVHPGVDWNRRLEIIRELQKVHAADLKRIETEEQQGPPNLYELFQSRLTQNLRSFPFLRRQMNCSLLFQVEGSPGGQWEVDLRMSSGCFREGDSGDWLIRITIPSSLLAAVVTDPDGWETLGISYKLDVTMKKGALAKEGLLNRLIHTPTPLGFIRLLLAPRFAEFVLRRRREFMKLFQQKLFARA